MLRFLYGRYLVFYRDRYVECYVRVPGDWVWDWGIVVPERRDCRRLIVLMPWGIFAVNGWLSWGRRPAAEVN